MYEACGEGFAEPTEYVRQMLPVTLADEAVERGLDLHLQLAGDRPAADRLGAVSGASSGVPHHPHIHLALDITPFFGRAQHADQFLEQLDMLGRVFEPGQEIEGLAEVAAVIELPRDRGQVFQAVGDMAATCPRKSAGALPGSVPTRPPISGSGSAPRRLPPARPSPACTSASRVFSAPLDIAQMAGDAGQPPRGLRRQQRQRDGLGMPPPKASAPLAAARPSPPQAQ